MIYKQVDFEIKQEASITQVHLVIRDFVDSIRKNEPGTLMYSSFQSGDNERKMAHLMSFASEKDEIRHRQSSYCERFVAKLYPLCTEIPKVTELKLISQK